MKLIELSKRGKNKGKYFAMVDDEDYEWLMQWNWHSMGGTHRYAYRRSIRDCNGFQELISMHREIIGLQDKNIFVDHINGNGLDNRRCNLRKATHMQNMSNLHSQRGASKYRGVSIAYSTRGGGVKVAYGWRVFISFNGSREYLGVFKNEIDAAITYDKRAKELYGDFFIPNINTEHATQ